MKDKFTYQNVMIKSNGIVYLSNPDDRSIIKTLDKISYSRDNRIHFAMGISINNTKFYVDAISGQVISTSQIYRQITKF